MPTKLTIEIQYANLAIEAAVSRVANTSILKKWVRAATSYGGLLTLRFVNTAEGKKLNLSFRKKDYATNLIVHGCLHAQAYDHETKKDAEKMEALELNILSQLGFTNPYIAQ